MRADKQRDLLDGALRVFARDGFSRASVGALASSAGVSTRTIYNQYGNKEALFRAVILDSATAVADRQIDHAATLLGRITDPREDLISFGEAWSTREPETALHFAMVRQVVADREHIDPDVLDAWQEAGPRRVRDAIAGHLRRHADAGVFRIDDERIAAVQLVQLTAGSVDSIPGVDVNGMVRAGVDVFLAAYGV
ncbi:TetR/AcrR family transcriptional regulator [Gordonia humi]|uniref:AcrR family transcriptional regulator n=1 Tax=Gordonia humi TaxID=686429 RepID=A0A840F445_9ACTN|nr:TetR/AcrR family transcriptional regulator [Gordonia humi]MBB4134347.1 AcrR family transcriptional regulator [Gordonia humi]